MSAVVAAGTMGSGRAKPPTRGLRITKASRRTPGRERPATVAGQPWLAGFCWVPAFLPVTGCFIKHHQTPLEVEKYADSLCGR